MFIRKNLALSSAIAIVFSQTVWAADPVTDIQADVQSFIVSLHPGDQINVEADWWLLANHNGSWYHYQFNSGWAGGLYTTYQGPLEAINNKAFFDLQGLSEGNYTLYFGVDTQPNGQMDVASLFYSSTSTYIANSSVTPTNQNLDTSFSMLTGSDSTAGILCDYDKTVFNDSPSVNMTSTATWSCTATTRELVANGIPDHATGTFPNVGNPNTITEQYVSISYPLTPVQTDTTTVLGGPTGATGYVLNGVKIDAATAGSCDDSGNACSMAGNTGNWNIEALGQNAFDFGEDENNAHVQSDGSYHYHGMPEGFIALQGGNRSSMTLIAWAADGFPIYARYGYTIATDATSALKSMTGSYQLVSNVSSSRPSTDIYPLGTFGQDWEYVAGSGDLDQCNGRFGVTPEFPNGIYHYYATDTYPYFQRCVTGQLAVDGGGGSSTNIGASEPPAFGPIEQTNTGIAPLGGSRPPMGPPRR